MSAKTNVRAEGASRQNIPLGLTIVLLGILLFTAMDVCAKLLTEALPGHQIAFLRNFVAMPIVLVIVLAELSRRARKANRRVGLQDFKLRQWRTAAFRGLLIAVAQFSFFSALAHLPLATVATIAYIAPALLTAMGALFLREQVGRWRWSAVAIGFIGVLIIQRPFGGGDAFSLWTALPLVTALGYAAALILVKTFDDDASSAVVTLYAAVVATVTTSALLLLGTEPIPREILPQVLLLGLFGGIGHFLLNVGFRLAPASVIAPFEYAGLVLSYLATWLIWRELPEPIVWAGGALIVTAGVIIIIRERMRMND